jgi:uncharacterized protein with ParB-like and HNH nuclease domain
LQECIYIIFFIISINPYKAHTQKIQLISNGDVLTTTKVDVIEIPMIQRDYAQGRLNTSDKEKQTRLNPTGEKFIKELFSFLNGKSSETQMELDFVYGSLKEIDKIVYFYPLDGQQRLTTLFLLYWFIGGVELNDAAKNDLSNILGNFYYTTRRSSNLFCENIVKELCNGNIDFLLREFSESEPPKTLISQIENMSWFHDSYKLDPTVQSMLNMLDKIQELYLEYQSESIFENLDKLRFYILPLSNFDLTEDLYVKMNARGKQLTSFENFKAEFEDQCTRLFGSGWVWLAEDEEGELHILQTPNAGNPITRGMIPIMVFDVWEHAYYVDYKNRRSDYIASLWNIINWEVINCRYVK